MTVILFLCIQNQIVKIIRYKCTFSRESMVNIMSFLEGYAVIYTVYPCLSVTRTYPPNVLSHKGFADLKSSNLYENLPVQTKMTIFVFCLRLYVLVNNFSVILGRQAILSRALIIQAIMLYEQFIHHMQINLSPNTDFFSLQQCA